MLVQLKLNVDQIAAAILLLEREEKESLKQRLPVLFELEAEKLEDFAWLRLAESAFDFWDNPAEDVYNDLITTTASEH